jgi:hypothetical protein
LAVTPALVAADLNLAADVGRHLAAQVTFDLVIRFDVVAQLDQFLVAQLVDASVGADPRLCQGLQGAGLSDSVDVRESDLDALVAR